jgi:transcriptional regulator NrdR family protein
MNCPQCSHADSVVIDSRDANGGFTRRRRHKCSNCNHRWSTKELPVELIDQAIEVLSTHLAIEDAYATTFGRSREIVTKLFEK